MDFLSRVQQGILVCDGAMGTELQRLSLSPEDWAGAEGCVEVLNLSVPHKVEQIHRAYLEAGADIIETNTLGANGTVLSEFGLQDKIEAINLAAATAARAAVRSMPGERLRFVAGSIGPGNKLPSLNQVSWEQLHQDYLCQARGLLQGGVDLFIIETSQDLLQVKAALAALRDACRSQPRDVPLLLAVTLQQSGTMLVGSGIATVLSTLKPFSPAMIGLNCGGGPEQMDTHLLEIRKMFDGPLLAMPNAGLPLIKDGTAHYSMGAEEFAACCLDLVRKHRLSLIGGCCGTTPEHIRALRAALDTKSGRISLSLPVEERVTNMDFRERMAQGIVLLDGATGTEIQKLHPTEEEWDGKTGCSEILNLTAGDKIRTIHASYYAAGSDVVETNTFGANRIVLAEYGLEEQVIEINSIAARLAREAAEQHSDQKPRFVAGSMGPGTRLASLGQASYDELYASYREQAEGLLAGGVDLFMIETCQDLLQIKAARNACRDVCLTRGKDIPVLVSVTVETTGTMLVGSEIGAAIAALTPLDIDILGINCATGPDRMAPYIKEISSQFPGAVMVMPNAGMPENVHGEMVYSLAPEDFAATVIGYVRELGVRIVGGCCGTSPHFISVLHKGLCNEFPEYAALCGNRAARGQAAATRTPSLAPSLASLFGAQAMRQDPAPFYIGERANTNGSRAFRELLLAGDWDGIMEVAMEQQRVGAHALDLCVAYTGRDEIKDMVEAVGRFARQVTVPLVIDSTNPEVLEAALKLYGGRPLINSVNLENGEEHADRIFALAHRYGAALIALTIDEQGMARSVERKLEVAKRLYTIATERHGLRPEDLVFDVLTFTLGSGEQESRQAAMNTLQAIRRLKQELPGVFTVLGVSNISFGLSPAARRVLNSVFLHEAVAAGLDMAIVNVRTILPLHKIDDADRKAAMDLIQDRNDDALFAYIRHFEGKQGKVEEEGPREADLPLEERIRRRVINGSKAGLEDMLEEKLQDTAPVDIINGLLIPAMKVVGDLFGSGEMQLPFVLQSAEVMKFAVDKLEPYMEKRNESEQTSLVLATVKGDVHDIGKNLVDIILSNNGFRVHNLGIKVEIGTMLDALEKTNADALGMSGLLVKSTVIMKENLQEMKRRGIDIPVLLGGAALNRDYVDNSCDPLLDSPVAYCADAFAGLRVMNLIRDGRLDEAMAADRARFRSRQRPAPRAAQPAPVEDPVRHDVPVPAAPFFGDRVVSNIDLDQVYSYLTEQVLFRGRWGYRRGKMDKDEYETLIANEVRPRFEQLKQECRETGLFQPRLVYGYYPAAANGDDLIVYEEEGKQELLRLTFPRQQQPPHHCIADFFRPVSKGEKDLIALQVVTIGEKADQHAKSLYQNNQYKDYLLFHGLSVETAEALAEYWHKQIREELGIADQDGSSMDEFVLQGYRGSRYSFGYPACPSLEDNTRLFSLLKPGRIGVSFTENGQMVPEQTTSAFIVHHPQAKYFSV